MDPEDKDYKCTLNEYSLRKAIDELHEDPKQRFSQLKAFRAWIKSQPHFICRTDTGFVLQVLRTAKYSQLRSREIIENILTLRTKHPDFLVNLDTHDIAANLFLDKEYILPLPRDREGRLVMILRGGVTDPGDPRMNLVNEMRVILLVQHFLQEDENTFVNGVIIVSDLTGATDPKHLSRYGMDTTKKCLQIYQDCNPGRMKGVFIYNGGGFFDFIMALARSFAKKKFLERFQVHSTMESLYKVIPHEFWPDEYLPDDYKGPSAGPIKEIAANLKSRLRDPVVRARILDQTSERYKIDEKKKISGIPQASFRKLNID